jgi:hypothetical protein
MPGNSSSTDMSHYEIPTNHVDHNVAFEIDVSHPKRIQRALGLKNMDCYPILWCYQDL